MKDKNIYLRHILEAIENIESFIGQMSEGEFSKNVLVQSAVIRQLEVIGEAVKNLPSGLRKAHEHIPWKDIAGLRDKLIHEYFGVDISLVWGICAKDIPHLKNWIKNIPEK